MTPDLSYYLYREGGREYSARIINGMNKKGQTTESGIPQSFRATVRYSRIHLGFWPRSATLIGQLSLVPFFATNLSRYIVLWLFSSAVTAFLRDPYRFLSENIPCGPTLPEALHAPHRFKFRLNLNHGAPRHVDCMATRLHVEGHVENYM